VCVYFLLLAFCFLLPASWLLLLRRRRSNKEVSQPSAVAALWTLLPPLVTRALARVRENMT